VSLSKLIKKREVATATVATPATADYINTTSVATVASVAVANDETETEYVAIPDCIDTLGIDYAELKSFIAELCEIVGHTEEAQNTMLKACRNLYPFKVASERDYFRLQLEHAKAKRYWRDQPKAS
jgi:hypothetical protein